MFPGANSTNLVRSNTLPHRRDGDGARATGIQSPRRVRTEPELVERSTDGNVTRGDVNGVQQNDTGAEPGPPRVTIDDYFADSTQPSTTNVAPGEGSSSSPDRSDTTAGAPTQEDESATNESSTGRQAPGNLANNENSPGATPTIFTTRFRTAVPHQDRTPNVQWATKNKFTESGRVLLIDYRKPENGNMRIVAQEFQDINGLRRFFNHQQRANAYGSLMLRLIHVQNAESWATPFLLERFAIGTQDELGGTAKFASWVECKRPEVRRGRAPIMKAKKWRAQRDPWRGITRTACSFDYLKTFPIEEHINPSGREPEKKKKPEIDPDEWQLMELASYSETGDIVLSSHVHVQRLSFYIQNQDEHASNYAQPPEGPPIDLSNLDNNNAIIIFEHGRSSSANDSMIQARGTIESYWRRLTFYMKKSDLEVADPSHPLIAKITQDIFRGLLSAWEELLAGATAHTTIVEDMIYDSPADETRAPELWSIAKQWLKIERLMCLHCDVTKEMAETLEELLPSDDSRYSKSLDESNMEFERMAMNVNEELVKPISNLTTVMFQAVSFRDTRHSVQLNSSLWRLSWITFIFLPLTFTVGFFGMNVDTFVKFPSIKWFFVTAVPLMVLVVVLYHLLKQSGAQKIADPFQLRTINQFSRDLAIEHPKLWTPAGPRENVYPGGFTGRFKMQLIKRWFGAQTQAFDQSALKPSSENFAERRKRNLARRWLSKIDSRGHTQNEIPPDHGSAITP